MYCIISLSIKGLLVSCFPCFWLKQNNSNITNNVYHNEIRSSGVSSSSCCYSFCHSRRKAVILCCHSRGGERKVRALMESTLKETREGASVIDVDSESTVGGGVEEAYVEDRATEDHFVTPWTVSVARWGAETRGSTVILLFSLIFLDFVSFPPLIFVWMLIWEVGFVYFIKDPLGW